MRPRPWIARLRARVALLLLPLLFIAVNLLAQNNTGHLRLDLTQEDRFTLSPATLRLAESVEEPIVLRFHASRLLLDNYPAYAGHAARVLDFLEAFARRSGGRIVVERYDPAPYSPEEDLAVADGIQGLNLGDGSGELVYFGLAGRNSTDDRRAITFFSLERAPYLEYDLAQLLQSLAKPEKPRIGTLGLLSLQGDQLSGFEPTMLGGLLQQLFTTVPLDPAAASIPRDLDALLLIQPEVLTPAAVYALDQYVLDGGKLLLFVDPFSERVAQAAQMQGIMPRGADFAAMEPLFRAWGVSLDSGSIVADRQNARRVMAYSQGRQIVSDYVVWLALTQAGFDRSDPALATLTRLHFNLAGRLAPAPEATTDFQALVFTGDEGTLLPLQRVLDTVDPTELLADYAPQGRQTLVARVTGPATTAFPDGPPPEVTAPEPHRPQSAAGVEILLVADSDFLFDDTWLTGEGTQMRPTANNGDLVLNLLEAMSGQAGLATIRGRGLVDRPFTVIQDMQRAAEQSYRAREQALLDRIRAAEAEIGTIERSAEEGVVPTEAQEAAMETLRRDLLALRAELREVRRSLRDDLELLERRLQLLNIAAVPLLVALAGLVVALLRRQRRRHAY